MKDARLRPLLPSSFTPSPFSFGSGSIAKGMYCKRAVGDDHQPLVAKLGGDRREQGLAQGLGGGRKFRFGLRDTLLSLHR